MKRKLLLWLFWVTLLVLVIFFLPAEAVGKAIGGAIVSGIVTLLIWLGRKRDLQKYGFATENDPNDVTCTACGFDQWRGYKTCQKCGVVLTKDQK